MPRRLALLALLLGLGLAACDEPPDRDMGEAMREGGHRAGEAAERVGEALRRPDLAD